MRRGNLHASHHSIGRQTTPSLLNILSAGLTTVGRGDVRWRVGCLPQTQQLVSEPHGRGLHMPIKAPYRQAASQPSHAPCQSRRCWKRACPASWEACSSSGKSDGRILDESLSVGCEDSGSASLDPSIHPASPADRSRQQLQAVTNPSCLQARFRKI